jgi:hypothetical protein
VVATAPFADSEQRWLDLLEASVRLHSFHAEAGDLLKVPEISGRHRIAEFKGCGSDQDVREREAVSLGLQGSIDLSGSESGRDRHWMNGHSA